MKKFVWMLAFVLCFQTVDAMADKLFFATTDYPPLGFVENGQPAGSQVEIVRELCKRLGFECRIEVLPWQRALKYVRDGDADAIFAVRHNKERAEFLYFPSEPIGFEKTVIIALKDSGIKINKLDDLNGKTIGVVRGYAYDPKFDAYQGVKKTICNDDEQVVKMLAYKRFPLAAGGDEATIRYFCRQMNVEAETVYVINESPGYLAFSKKALGEKGPALAEKFAQALRQLREDGVILKIESKYF